MDAKGRLAVPVRFRERIGEASGGKLIVTLDITCGTADRCLVAYPYNEWQRIEERVQNLPAFDPMAQLLSQLLIGKASECELDGQGRVLIPQNLREYAGLGKRVQAIGQVTKFQLWDEGAWTARQDKLLGQIGSLSSELSDAMRGLVL